MDIGCQFLGGGKSVEIRGLLETPWSHGEWRIIHHLLSKALLWRTLSHKIEGKGQEVWEWWSPDGQSLGIGSLRYGEIETYTSEIPR